MKRLIYQVCLGQQSNSLLYEECLKSVQRYCIEHDIVHIVQTQPIIKIKPDVFATDRSKESYEKHGGYLPIYEKENAFDYMHKFDQIAIIDADIFIRDGSPNIFDDFGTDHAWGSVLECEMPITDQYAQKIKQYSRMQYMPLAVKQNLKITRNEFGYAFYNMGMIVINSENFKPYLSAQTAKEFIARAEFKDFVDGVGPWKWSTDQTLLNYFLVKYKVPVKNLSWKYNALYKGVKDECIPEAHFIHFFLKDKLPSGGENVQELMRNI
ncbi:MAG: hypothetical protein ACSHWR_07255 [Psychromonas sp.]